MSTIVGLRCSMLAHVWQSKKKRKPAPKTPAGASRDADTADSNGGGKRSSGAKKARAGRPQ